MMAPRTTAYTGDGIFEYANFTSGDATYGSMVQFYYTVRCAGAPAVHALADRHAPDATVHG
jgi:hypothetical protein